jgi:uncharacterized membrane protein
MALVVALSLFVMIHSLAVCLMIRYYVDGVSANLICVFNRALVIGKKFAIYIVPHTYVAWLLHSSAAADRSCNI